MSHEQFKEGALACLAVLRQCDLPACELAGEDYFESHDRAVAAIVQAAGPLAPKAAGALQVLAELFVNEKLGGGELDLIRWQPEACMTEQEREAARRALNESVKELTGPRAATVIELATRKQGAHGKSSLTDPPRP